MSDALAMDLRVRFRKLMEQGLCAAAAGRTLLISRATAARWGKRVRDGESLEPRPRGSRPGTGKLVPYGDFFAELLDEDPDMTLAELRGALQMAHGVTAGRTTIHRFLCHLGYTRKKGLIARERGKSKVKRARHEWITHRQPTMRQHPQRLVFIDETGTTTAMTRTHGRCPKGQRLFGIAPFRHHGNQTLIAALTCDTLIAPWIISGAMDRAAFDTYIEKVLAPELEPGTVVILDNVATHKSAKAAQLLKARGCWFLFLPAYSPDLNPIEMAFSKLKAHLRRIGARTFDQLVTAIGEICHLFSPEECWNFFHAAGYINGSAS